MNLHPAPEEILLVIVVAHAIPILPSFHCSVASLQPNSCGAGNSVGEGC